MLTGLGNTFIQPNTQTPPTVFPPFPLNAADNGLSVDPIGFEIVLGQTIGAVGDPAQLLSNREVPFNGFTFAIGKTTEPVTFGLDPVLQTAAILVPGDSMLFLDFPNDQYFLGSGFNGFQIDSISQLSLITINGAEYLDLNVATGRFRMGDTDDINNGNVVDLSDNTQRWDIGQRTLQTNLLLNFPGVGIGLSFFDSNGANPFLLPDPATGGVAFITAPDFSTSLSLADAASGTAATLGDIGAATTGMVAIVDVVNSLLTIRNTANTAVVNMNGVNGFTGVVAPVNTITVDGGIVTNVA